MAAEQLDFFCWVVGDEEKNIFKMKISAGNDVDDLKKAIKEDQRPRFDNSPTSKLDLWKVSFSTKGFLGKAKKWIKENDVLDPASSLSEVFGTRVPAKTVHIIMYILEGPPLKRRRYDTDAVPPTTQHIHADIPPDLLHLHRQFWGVPLDPMFTTLPNDVGLEYEETPTDLLPGEPFLMDISPPLLVRAEYIRVFDAVKVAHEEIHISDLAVVTGQPGIGKTLWIYYALRRCLGEKQPVVWYHLEACFFFSESGVDIINPLVHESGGMHTWCFVDSEDARETLPIHISSPEIRLFPVYVTSPKKSRWDQLDQLRNPRLIIMNPWTLAEIEKASRLFPTRGLDDIRDRFHKAGPTARLCLAFSPRSIKNYYDARENWMSQNPTIQLFEKLMGESNDLLLSDVSHKICLVYRSDPRKMYSYTIGPITLPVAHQLLVRLRRLEEEEVLDLLRRFFQVPGGDLIGLLFEAHCQQTFCKCIRLIAKPMFRINDPHSRWDANFSSNPKLQKALSDAPPNMGSSISLRVNPKRSIPYTRNKKLRIEKDVYYVPEASNEAAIDAIIFHKSTLYLLQFTRGCMHSIKADLEDIGDQFSGLPFRSKWVFMFVVPEGLARFECPHSYIGFLQDLIPYTAQVPVIQT